MSFPKPAGFASTECSDYGTSRETGFTQHAMVFIAQIVFGCFEADQTHHAIAVNHKSDMSALAGNH